MQPKIYEIISAPNDLSPFIRRYFYAEIELGGGVKIRAAPTGFCYLGHVFQGEAWGELDGEVAAFPSRFHFAGQVDHREYLVCYRGTLGHIMAEFTPTGANRLLGLSGSAIAHSCSDMFDVLQPNPARVLSEGLSAAQNKNARIDAFNVALREIAKVARPADQTIEMAVKIIEAEHGCIGLATLCQRLGENPRTISRRFKSLVGLSPKFFMRVVQFNTAVSLIHDNDDTALTNLAIDCGYFDQAHFIKSMQQFMGLCPRQYQEGRYHMFDAFIAQSRLAAKQTSPLAEV